jgi:hypothetical protein
VELGLRPADLEDLHPADVPALWSAWERRVRREDYRAGVIATMLAAAPKDGMPRPTPATFFPSLEPLFPPPEPDSDEEVERKLMALLGHRGGSQ